MDRPEQICTRIPKTTCYHQLRREYQRLNSIFDDMRPCYTGHDRSVIIEVNRATLSFTVNEYISDIMEQL